MHIFTVTNLYPDEERPRHGIFVQERLRLLAEEPGITVCVIQLFPTSSIQRWLNGGIEEITSRHEAIRVFRCYVPTVPLLTNWIDPFLWARAVLKKARRLLSDLDGSVVIDGQFLFPDGAAAVLIARKLGLPVVNTARGSDVNVKCKSRVIRLWVRWIAKQSQALITVSMPLATRLAELGVERKKLRVIQNGVDREKFQPQSMITARQRLGIGPGIVLLSAGNLVENKGHHFAIEFLARFEDATLLVAGDGPLRSKLLKTASKLQVSSRVRFLGNVDNEKMSTFYSAATFLILMSETEGMPNVMLESIACGTRVLATDAGGVKDVINSPERGRIIESRSVKGLEEAFNLALQDEVSREQTRSSSKPLAWDRQIAKQSEVYRLALA